MTEREKDERDLRICQLMDKPPHGEGRSAGEAARILSEERGEAVTRNTCLTQWARVREAMEKHS